MAGKPVFRAAPTRVRVPATSANLGPGYDCFALALSLYDDVVGQVSDDPGIRVDVHGEGADTLPRTARHLVVKAMLAAFDRLGGRPRGLDVVCANRIPQGRGLGSSAAAIVAGGVLARALVIGGEERLPDDELLDLAAGLEGHPDNVAAALAGGMTIAWTDRVAAAGSVRLSVLAPVVPVVCVPSGKVATRKARGLLPDQVPHPDAAANLARAALLVAALAVGPGRPDLLLTATEDRLHQDYRRPAYPRSADLVAKLRATGIAATISGAGPSVLALTTGGAHSRVAALAGARFATTVLSVDTAGATRLPLTD
ncbi:MAG TPA: homoserine kinase [Candidatus Nanopelagicales bacterium]|nr:homoserine kinase [Candidatus Nanopelagicales bacterium]